MAAGVAEIRALLLIALLPGCQRTLCWLQGGTVTDLYAPDLRSSVFFANDLRIQQECIIDVRTSWTFR